LTANTKAETLWGGEAPVIEADGLGKVYNVSRFSRSEGLWALRNVSFQIGSGRIVGLVGPNGAGKTTLMTLAAGIVRPAEGHICICGNPSRSIEAQRSLGYMPEQPAFLGLYTPKAVLRYHGALLGLSRNRIRSETDKLLCQLELERADRPTYGFSQGMKQRLSLAMALMGDPEILLLDEPSNGLDPIAIVKLRELLMALCAAGKTILISSHRLGELDRLTEHFIFLNQGRVVRIDDTTASSNKKLLRIGLLAGGRELADMLAARFSVLDSSDTLAIVAVGDVHDIPTVVRKAVQAGFAITEVTLQKEDIEDVFVRLYKDGDASCEHAS